MKTEILEKYAKLIARTGANVQPGQIVSITAAVEEHAFAAMVAKECYLAGAKKVNMEWNCDTVNRMHYEYGDEDYLKTVLPWEEEKMKQQVEDLPVRIFIESSDPDAMAGLDAEKLSSVMQARGKVMRKYRSQMDGKYQWCIAAIPAPAWAMKCFPDLTEEEAMAKLWEAVLKTVRISEDTDPVDAWKEHVAFLTERFQWMNAQKFDTLHYESANGTHFTVKLNPLARWEAASEKNPANGAVYIPNMPTEEVFTSPLVGHCEGTLVSTKPLSWNGQLIENFSITFENGKAVSCKAGRGQELLEKMIHMDEYSCMLGEVALVPKESPINQCGFLFNNTLFDENACCHFALGMGFKELIPGGLDMTSEEAREKGVNDSIIHVDFMVGSDDLSIIGKRADGTETVVFANGTWA